eukprot:Seg3647.3 transcript_id=Seg3647.3/GoldUCD/mRNA.D3Y31 product="hypothetical protein" protein_id=Seg3647.3/GoldUCD/D3Y31
MYSSDEEPKGARELHKLQLMLRNLEERNDLPSPEKIKAHDFSTEENNQGEQDEYVEEVIYLSNNVNNNSEQKIYEKIQVDSFANKVHLDLNKSLLEDEFDSINMEEDISIVEEDSWLLETPTKREITAVKKPKLWLDEDVRTPELNRVKGTLASKLDLIAIQSRKEKLNSLLTKHSLGSHAESAPGRLYQAESMCSVMSLDWEYDEEFGGMSRARQASAITDSPIRRREHGGSFEDGGFDELQPMSLNFDSPPAQRRSVQVAPGPVITRRTGPNQGARTSPDRLVDGDGSSLIVRPTGGIRPRTNRMEYERPDSRDSGSGHLIRRSSLSDRSDSSGEYQGSPRSSIGSSRNSLGSVEDVGIRKPRGKDDRRFEPVRRSKTALPKTASSAMSQGGLRSSNDNISFSKQRSSAVNDSADPSLTVKLTTESQDGPVLRRRGANPSANSSSLSLSGGSIPRSRGFKPDTSRKNKEQMTSSPVMKSNMQGRRTSAPIQRRNFPLQKGVSPRGEGSQSPEFSARRASSPEARSRSPDLIARKGGIVPRGQATNRSQRM